MKYTAPAPTLWTRSLALLALAVMSAAHLAADEARALQVAPYLVENPAGTGPALFVRALAGGQWAALSTPIKGFRHQWGYEYQICVAADPEQPETLALVGEPDRTRIDAGTPFTVLLNSRSLALTGDGRGTVLGRKAFALAEDTPPSALAAALKKTDRLRLRFSFGSAPSAPLVLTGWGSPLDGVLWHLTSLNGKPPLPGSQITAAFRDGRVGGKATVNQYMGTYNLRGAKLSFGNDMVTTKMMGEPAEMGQEMAFMWALEKVARAAVTQSTLTLSDSKGRALMTFADAPPSPLEGVQWNLVSIEDRPVIAGKVPHITLSEGRLSGDGGINLIMGAYTLDGARLSFSDVISTKMAGEPGAMIQESDLLQALDRVRSWALQDSRLRLMDADAATLLTFTAP